MLQCECQCKIFQVNDSRDKFTCVACKKEYFSEVPTPPKSKEAKESKKKAEEEAVGKDKELDTGFGPVTHTTKVTKVSVLDQSPPIDFEPETDNEDKK